MEDVDRGVVVPIQGHAAMAIDPAIREGQMLEEDTATGAGLGRVGGIYQDDLPTGAFSLVRETAQQVGPARIQDTQGEVPACHRGDAEVFEHDPIEPLDQVVSELLEEILSGVCHRHQDTVDVSQGDASTRSNAVRAGT